MCQMGNIKKALRSFYDATNTVDNTVDRQLTAAGQMIYNNLEPKEH